MTINYSQNEHYDTVSLNGFQQLIFSHLDAISDARFGIVDGRQLLESKESLRPMECDDILLSLRVLLDSVRSFEGLLKNNINVPSTVAPKRYKVFVKLHRRTYQTSNTTSFFLPLHLFGIVSGNF